MLKHLHNPLGHHHNEQQQQQGPMTTSRLITANDFPFKGAVSEIDSKTTIEDALDTLVKNGVLSAPVWDDEQKKYAIRLCR